MKNSFYFPHDYHARHDPKLERLRMEVGPVSDGIFWNIVEMLYEEGGYLNTQDIPLYAKMINADEQMFNKVVNNLFITDGERFYNQSLLDRLNHINKVREERRISGKASGKARQTNTCSTSDEHLRNNIKESKVNKEKKEEMAFPFKDFWDKYPRQVGAGMAAVTFKATVKTEADFKDLMSALNNYKASDEVKAGKIMNGDRWLEDWRGWVKVKPRMRITC